MVTDALHEGHVILLGVGPTGVPASVEIHCVISMRLNSRFHKVNSLKITVGFCIFTFVEFPIISLVQMNTPDGALYC